MTTYRAEPTAVGRDVLVKAAATAIAGVTVAFLLWLAPGKGNEGLGMVLALAPLVGTLAVAWRWPTAAGVLLLVVGGLVLLIYLVSVSRSGVAGADLPLLAPPLAAGLVFLLAGRLARRAE